jgi:hypothetical protein
VLDKKERWEELCDLASKEQDPQKLIELIEEINRLLEAKLERLRASKRSLHSKEHHASGLPKE